MSKNNPARVMDSPGRPVLPPQAEAEILDRLFTDTRISSGEIAAILKKHGVRGSQLFQQVCREYPERKEWPAICTVCLGNGGRLDNGVIDADELDMTVIREAGDRILKQPEISLVPPRQLRVPVMDRPVRTSRQKAPER